MMILVMSAQSQRIQTVQLTLILSIVRVTTRKISLPMIVHKISIETREQCCCLDIRDYNQASLHLLYPQCDFVHNRCLKYSHTATNNILKNTILHPKEGKEVVKLKRLTTQRLVSHAPIQALQSYIVVGMTINYLIQRSKFTTKRRRTEIQNQSKSSTKDHLIIRGHHKYSLNRTTACQPKHRNDFVSSRVVCQIKPREGIVRAQSERTRGGSNKSIPKTRIHILVRTLSARVNGGYFTLISKKRKMSRRW